MKNKIACGEVLDYVVPAETTIASGDLVQIGDVHGVAVTVGTEGETIAVNVEGVYAIPKVSGEMVQGSIVYWNHTQKKVTLTSTGFKPVGYIYRTAASADTTAEVNLKPIARIAVAASQIEASGATTGQVLKYDGTAWKPAADA